MKSATGTTPGHTLGRTSILEKSLSGLALHTRVRPVAVAWLGPGPHRLEGSAINANDNKTRRNTQMVFIVRTGNGLASQTSLRN